MSSGRRTSVARAGPVDAVAVVDADRGRAPRRRSARCRSARRARRRAARGRTPTAIALGVADGRPCSSAVSAALERPACTRSAMPCCWTRSLVLAVLEHGAERGVDRRLVELGHAERGRAPCAQSIVSATPGGLYRSRPRSASTAAATWRASGSTTCGHAQPHDRDLALEVGVLDPVVQAAALERVVHVAGAVRREHDDRRTRRRGTCRARAR